MLENIVSKNLELAEFDRPPSFCLGLSGGIDSRVLLELLCRLRKTFKFDLKAVHLNYHLRGKDSERDEAFVRKICVESQVELQVHSVNLQKSTAIQEQARMARLEAYRALPSHDQIIEAHHGDDLVESFLLRLFRGASLNSLVAMKLKSKREGRWLWRPLLEVPKAELMSFAQLNALKFRKDLSNNTVAYDRNFIRNKILPLTRKRFPLADNAILRSLKNMQSLQDDYQELIHLEQRAISDQLLKGELDWNQWAALPESRLRSLVHDGLKEVFGIRLSQIQTIELCKKLKTLEKFSFNAPQDVVFKSHTKFSKVYLTGGRPLKPTKDL